MTHEDIKDIFESYFEKFKKTEGEQTSWSAFWADYSALGKFEINLTKCPRGTIFKSFVNSKKLPEIVGWDDFFAALPEFQKAHAGVFDIERFFSGMKEMT